MPKSIQTPQPITETLEYLQGIFEHIEQEQPTAEQIQKLIKVAKAPLQHAVSIVTEQPTHNEPCTKHEPTHNERSTDVEQGLNSQATIKDLTADLMQKLNNLQNYISIDDYCLDGDLTHARITSIIKEINGIQCDFESGNAGEYLHKADDELNAYGLLEMILWDLGDLLELVNLLDDLEQNITDLQSLQDEYNDLKQPLNTSEPSQATLIPLYGVYRNDEPIFITGSMQTAHPERIAHDIKAHLEAVTDDQYTLEVIQWVEDDKDNPVIACDMHPRKWVEPESMTVPVSYTDKWEG